MKFKTCLTVMISVLSVSTAVMAETKAPASEAAPASDAASAPDAKMEAWLKASTPGAEHKLLENYVGRWNYTTRVWMDPKAKPEVSQGTVDIDSILGGRFIRQQIKGTAHGQPFEGLGVVGYDNVQKHFSTMWIDNMGTAMMQGEGEYDKARGVIAEKGSFSCPVSPTGKVSYRSVMTLPKKNSFKYETFTVGEEGKETRMMEVVYTKAN